MSTSRNHLRENTGMPARAASMDERKVGPYRLRRLIGRGGMGEVYQAEHERLQRPCAVKLIRGDRARHPEALARFEHEAQAAAKLTHPNTVAIFDFGVTDGGEFFYAMELLPGLSLQDVVERTGPLPAARVIHLLRQVCSALAEAHAHGMIHRDIKPANIIAAERGGIFDFAKLLDFGLVKTGGEADVEITHEGLALGSPLYAAPELTVGDNEIDARTDIYSLGATAYFLLTGRPVFAGENPLKIVFAHAYEQPTPPTELQSDIPAELEAIILRCLAKSPDDRFASVEELEQALARCAPESGWTQDDAKTWWRQADDFAPAQPPQIDECAETSIIPRLAGAGAVAAC